MRQVLGACIVATLLVAGCHGTVDDLVDGELQTETEPTNRTRHDTRTHAFDPTEEVPCPVDEVPVGEGPAQVQITPRRSESILGEPNCFRISFQPKDNETFEFARLSDRVVSPLLVNITDPTGAGFDLVLAGGIMSKRGAIPLVPYALGSEERYVLEADDAISINVSWNGSLASFGAPLFASPGVYEIKASFVGKNHSWDANTSATVRLLANTTAVPELPIGDCRGLRQISPEGEDSEPPRFRIVAGPDPWMTGTWGCIVVSMTNTWNATFETGGHNSCVNWLEINIWLDEWTRMLGPPDGTYLCFQAFWSLDFEPGESIEHLFFWNGRLPGAIAPLPAGTYRVQAGWPSGSWDTMNEGNLTLTPPSTP